MELDNSLFRLINGVIWPALGFFELVIAIIAQSKYKHSSTNLLQVGAGLGLVTSLSYPFINLLGVYGDAIQIIYAILSLLGLVANLVFLIGLLNLVNYLATIKTGENTISETC